MKKVISYSGYAEVKLILKTKYFGFIAEPWSLVVYFVSNGWYAGIGRKLTIFFQRMVRRRRKEVIADVEIVIELLLIN